MGPALLLLPAADQRPLSAPRLGKQTLRPGPQRRSAGHAEEEDGTPGPASLPDQAFGSAPELAAVAHPLSTLSKPGSEHRGPLPHAACEWRPVAGLKITQKKGMWLRVQVLYGLIAATGGALVCSCTKVWNNAIKRVVAVFITGKPPALSLVHPQQGCTLDPTPYTRNTGMVDSLLLSCCLRQAQEWQLPLWSGPARLGGQMLAT